MTKKITTQKIRNKTDLGSIQSMALNHSTAAAAVAAKSLQSCLTLCNPIEQQPIRLPRPWDSPGKNTGVGCHFLLQCMKEKSESEAAQSSRLLVMPWTAAYWAPPSMGLSRQEYQSGMPLPSLEPQHQVSYKSIIIIPQKFSHRQPFRQNRGKLTACLCNFLLCLF